MSGRSLLVYYWISIKDRKFLPQISQISQTIIKTKNPFNSNCLIDKSIKQKFLRLKYYLKLFLCNRRNLWLYILSETLYLSVSAVGKTRVINTC